MTRNGVPPNLLLPQQVGVQQQIIKTDLADSVVYGFVAGGQPMLLLYAGMSKLEQAALMMAQGMASAYSSASAEAMEGIANDAVILANLTLAACAKAQQPTTEGA